MDELQVSFQIYGDSSEKHTIVPIDLNFNEALEVAQFILGAPNDSYQLGLGRTKEVLSPLATFKSSNIQPNDKLVLIANDKLENWKDSPPPQSHSVNVDSSPKTPERGKLYTLFLTILGSEVQQWTYSIRLAAFYEDHPQQFFDDNYQERKKFEIALSQVMPRQLKSDEIDKIIHLWCEDIEQGYQNISLKL